MKEGITMDNKPYYDVHGLVAAFGGRNSMRDKIKRVTGEEVKKKTLDKWCERNSIPSDVLVKCEPTAKELHLGFSIVDFIKP